MLKTGGSFGKRMSKKFKIGDLVSWKNLGKGNHRDLGLVVDFFEKVKGGRKLVYAKVVRFRDKATVSVPVLSLKNISGENGEIQSSK